jgi:hypothetical protein
MKTNIKSARLSEANIFSSLENLNPIFASLLISSVSEEQQTLFLPYRNRTYCVRCRQMGDFELVRI